jgi:hypothetical protein
MNLEQLISSSFKSNGSLNSPFVFGLKLYRLGNLYLLLSLS